MQSNESVAQDHTGRVEDEADRIARTLAEKCADTVLRCVDIDADKSTVMDYACGTGLLSELLAEHAESLYGVDSNPQLVALYNERVANRDVRPPGVMKAVCIDLKERGTVQPNLLRHDEFHAIICANAYHRFEDINMVTKTLASYLKPDYGELIVIDMIHSPASESFHETQDRTIIHKGGFEEEAIRNAFTGAGLRHFSFKKAFDINQGENTVEFFVATGGDW